MKRAAVEQTRTHREWRKHWLSHLEANTWRGKRIGVSAYVVDCPCDMQKGRFRKRKGLGCPVCKKGKGCKVVGKDTPSRWRLKAKRELRQALEQ